MIPVHNIPDRLAGAVSLLDADAAHVERALLPDPTRVLQSIIVPTVRNLPSKIGQVDFSEDKQWLNACVFMRLGLSIITMIVVGVAVVGAHVAVQQVVYEGLQYFVLGIATVLIATVRKAVLSSLDIKLVKYGAAIITRATAALANPTQTTTIGATA